MTLRTWRRSRGFSMVELLIALSIGVILAMAATQLFVTNTLTMSMQRSLNDVQDSGRYALDFITGEARYIGKPDAAGLVRPGIIFQVADIPSMASSSSVSTMLSREASTALGIGASDDFTIQYPTATDTYDCEGNKVPATGTPRGMLVVEHYFVRAATAAEGGAPAALACDGGYVDPNQTPEKAIGLGDAGIVLVPSIDSFEVLYGVVDPYPLAGTNTNAPYYRTPTHYVNATQYNALVAAALAANLKAPAITTVSIGMLVRSTEASNNAKMATTQSIRVLDASIAASSIPNDGRMRRLFQTTIALRNSML